MNPKHVDFKMESYHVNSCQRRKEIIINHAMLIDTCTENQHLPFLDVGSLKGSEPHKRQRLPVKRRQGNLLILHLNTNVQYE